MELSEKVKKQLLSKSSIEALSEKTGLSAKETKKVAAAAIPLMIEEMAGNAKTKSGAKSLSSALKYHAGDDISDIPRAMKKADETDGGKIVKHVLGGNKETLTDAIAKQSGVSKKKTGSILATLAPLLLSLLGSQQQEEEVEEDGLSGMLAGVLGGGSSSSNSNSSGNVAGDLLGSLLGGGSGSSGSSSSGLGTIASLLLSSCMDDNSSSNSSSNSGSSSGNLLGGLLGNLFGDDD